MNEHGSSNKIVYKNRQVAYGPQFANDWSGRDYVKQKKENHWSVQWQINKFEYFCPILGIYFVTKENNKDAWNKLTIATLLSQFIANLTKICVIMCMLYFRREESRPHKPDCQ